MNKYFPEIKGNFGFGCMRFPITPEKKIDTDTVTKMVDAFLDAGFNYFDTAHGYLRGASETTLKECLTSRYPRDAYILTNKLSTPHFNSEQEIRPLFEAELEACGVDYFDFFLMHAQSRDNYPKYQRCRAYEIAQELKREGKVRHVGISFHDDAETLEMILSEHPEVEVVQIQFNYVDFDDASVQSGKLLEVCRKHGKPAIVMEPVKGGSLVNLPDDAKKIFAELGGSPASYAIRFAAGFDGIFMVLSGMGNMDMMRENIGFMADFKTLDDVEMAAVDRVRDIFKAQDLIPCTACSYCTEKCPKNIPIPSIFSCLNEQNTFKNWNAGYYYSVHTGKGGKASECIGCGMCESVCPQHLEIRKLLRDAVDKFEKKE